MMDKLISQQAAIDALDCINGTEEVLRSLPSVQPFHNITMTDVLKYIDDMPEDVWQEFTQCLRCRGWELQWCGGDFT